MADTATKLVVAEAPPPAAPDPSVGEANPPAAAPPAAPAAPPPAADRPDAAAGGAADKAAAAGPSVGFVVTWGKERTELKRPASSTVSELKAEVQRLWSVPPARQKLMFKGLVKEDAATLEKVGIKDGSKVLLIGSREEDVAAAAQPQAAAGTGAAEPWDAPPPAEEPMCKQTQHAKVLAKGRPEDGLPGISGRQVPLPEGQNAIPGLLNSQGSKVRLTFRPDLQQLWIGSATYTQKIPYASVRTVEAWPIDGSPGYSIVALGLGAGKLWIYYFPSQLVSTVKLRVIGMGALLM